jgi:ATP-binding cassette subfamily B multidrug efflux pump
MIYRRFEQWIDIFREAPTESPPSKVLAFYIYYLRQVWPTFAVLLVVGLIGALIEVALFRYLSRIIDLAQGTPNVNFFKDNALELTWMVVVTLIARPIFIGLHDLLVHQTISPGMTSMIRWQNHNYVLKQSMNFFHSDFAGRIAQRIMQTGNSLRDSAVAAVDALWHVLIYSISALVLFAEADWRLMIPLICWMVLYILSLYYFVPRVKERAVISSDARSKLMGRIVDGYSNIATLKLFAHTSMEQQYARENPAGEPRHHQHGLRHYRHQWPVDRRHHGPGPVVVEQFADLGRGHCPGYRLGDPDRQYVRLDHVGGQRDLREYRHGPGRPADHFPAGQRD